MPLDSHIGLRAFADELARCGLREACTSPGSRSTPLVLALVREPAIRATSHVDERGAAFFALGAALASGAPVALACTSGTATANYLPAVAEAHEAGVPLLVLTADRPPELRDIGAGQTIDQVKLYGRNVKWYLEVDDAPATPERMRWMRQLACRAYWTALEGRPGPVHLNFALREPLAPGGPLEAEEPGGGGRPDGRPWLERAAPPPPTAPRMLVEEIERRPRALIVAGRLPDGGPDLAHFASRCRIPLLADPLSGARGGEAIAHYDALLRVPEFAAAHAPDLVIRAGDLPTSKPLRQWLAGLDARQIALDPHLRFQDPTAGVQLSLPLDPGAAVRALELEPVPWAPEGWIDSWRAADDAALEAMGSVLGREELSEPNVAAALCARLTGEDTLVVASSMPIRDVETTMITKFSPPRVLANRGANGIDGTVATALGAVAARGGNVVLLIGDVALAHDVGSLLALKRLGLPLTIVLLDNDGGGIFEFLPVAGEADAFEEHVATPHGLDFREVAALYGLAYVEPADLPDFHAELERVLGTPALIHVRTDRRRNVELHGRMWDAVAESVRSAA